MKSSPESDSLFSKSSIRIILLIVILVLVAIAVFLVLNKETPQPTQTLDSFTSCLGEKGAKLYGAFWCSACNAQKQQFKESAQFLPYVECSTPDGKSQTAACKAIGIPSYPTWIFSDNSRLVGVQSFAKLGEKTGCALPA